MEYTRLLKHMMSGADVKAAKDRLVELGYLYASTHDTFGDDTLAAVKSFQKGNGLEVDGIIGPDTWAALFADAPDTPVAPDAPSDVPEFTRNLKKGMSGADVKAAKDRLVELGYLYASTHDTFGNDTYEAVKAFQSANGLSVDGVIGAATWSALFGSPTPAEPVDPSEIPLNIGRDAAKKIARDLSGVSATRKKIVLEALRWAWHADAPTTYPPSLYIRGGNLYNTDLKPNYITAKRIEDGARRQPEYYTPAAKQIMLDAVAANPNTTGADCSGGIVGLMRYARVVSSSFDAAADSLCGSSHSSAVDKSALIAGDWVGKSGHIGLYVGGGYVVEWVGHKNGCQLTVLSSRKVYDFTTGKSSKYSAWTKYRRPKHYN